MFLHHPINKVGARQRCGHVRRFEDLISFRACSETVTRTLPCGHQVSTYCGLKNPKCQVKLVKRLACGHVGEVTCGNEQQPGSTRSMCPSRRHETTSYIEKIAQTICPFKVLHTLPCGHSFYTCKTEALQCHKKIQKTLACGHSVKVACGKQSECPMILQATLPCRHRVNYRCGTAVPKCDQLEKFLCACGRIVRVSCGKDPSHCGTCGRNSCVRLGCGHLVPRDPFGNKPAVCTEKITALLACGHVADYQCGQRCPPCTYTAKILKNCGHEVLVACGSSQNFSSACLITEELACGHSVTYQCGEERPPCKFTTQMLRECGHRVSLPCNSSKSLGTLCKNRCNKMCKRGHFCWKCHPSDEKCPPCDTEVCFTFSNCLHRLEIRCFEGDRENTKVCVEACGRQRNCNHICPLPCGLHLNDKCPPCEISVKRTRYCGHELITLCKVDISREDCNEKVDISKLSYCGHTIKIECSQEELLEDGEGVLYCNERCGFYFDPKDGGCGHYCPGTCNLCAKSRFHNQCLEKCNQILFCGHECISRCSSVCVPCQSRCQNWCEHSPCNHICSLPCLPCPEPCNYECPHGKCTKQCGEICNKVRCLEKCPKKLEKCDHPCVGYCGEICPDLCGICDSEELLKVCYDGRGEIEASNRFIMLADCGHCIDAVSMDRLMTVEVVEGEIVTKRCPLCRDVIRRCTRYSAELAKVKQDVEKVKKLVYGDVIAIHKYQEEISKALFTLYDYDWRVGKKRNNRYNLLLREKILDQLFCKDEHGVVISFQEMSIQLSHTLSIVTKIFVQSLLLRLTRMASIPTNFCDEFVSFSNLIIGFITDRPWPLTPFERKALDQEWLRLTTMAELLAKLSKNESDMVKRLLLQPRAQDAFMTAYEAIHRKGPYNEKSQARFATALAGLEIALQCQIGISEAERIDILKAFDSTNVLGRWFKCPNGHIYVVTECGGVTEEGMCNECGAKIGGKNHSVLPTNDLASEMDGAMRPLYPTALEHV